MIKNVAKTLIFNADGELLVLRRSEFPTKPWLSHTPDIPGGLVEAGESLAKAAAREIAEEMGIKVDSRKLQLVFAKTFWDEKELISKNALCYKLDLDEAVEIKLSFEHEGFAWKNPRTVYENQELNGTWTEALKYLLDHKEAIER